MRTEELIAQLGTELTPVRPLPPPGRRALVWLALASLLLGGIVLAHGLRSDLLEQISRTSVLLEWVGSVLTGALAAVAAFHLALPDRSSRWALLPLPAAVLWLSGLGIGCVGEVLREGASGAQLGTSFSCLGFIIGTSVPLGVLMLLMLRHAGPIRPRPVALLAALASAALCSAALSLFHGLDSALMVLIWHGGAVALLLVVAGSLARLLYGERPARPSALGG